MARKSDREALGVSAAGRFAEGILQGYKSKKELEQIAAERAIKEQAAKIDALNAAINLEKASRETQVQESYTGPDGKPATRTSSLPGLPAEQVNRYREVLRPALGLPPLPSGVGVGQQQGRAVSDPNNKARTGQMKGFVTLADGTKKVLNYNTASQQLELGDLPPGMEGGVVTPTVAPTLPAGEAAALGDINTARTLLRELTQKAEGLKFGEQTGGLMGFAKPYVEAARVSDRNPFRKSDPNAAEFAQYVALTKQVIGKGLEGGVLRKEDELKYDAIMPKGGDSKAILRAKASALDKMLQEKGSNLTKAFNQTGFRTVPSMVGASGAPTAQPAPAATADPSARIMQLIEKAVLSPEEAEELRQLRAGMK